MGLIWDDCKDCGEWIDKGKKYCSDCKQDRKKDKAKKKAKQEHNKIVEEDIFLYKEKTILYIKDKYDVKIGYKLDKLKETSPFSFHKANKYEKKVYISTPNNTFKNTIQKLTQNNTEIKNIIKELKENNEITR